MGVIISVCHIPEEMHGLFRLRAVLVHSPGRPSQQGGYLAAVALWQAHGIPVLVHLSGHLPFKLQNVHACAQVHAGLTVDEGLDGVLRAHIPFKHHLIGLYGVLGGFKGEYGAAVGLVVPQRRVGDALLAHPAPEDGVEKIGLHSLVYGQPALVPQPVHGLEKAAPDHYGDLFAVAAHIQVVLVEPVPAVVEHYLVVGEGDGVYFVPAHKAHDEVCGVGYGALLGPGVLVWGQVHEPVRVPGELLFVLIIVGLAGKKLDVRRVLPSGGDLFAMGVICELYLGVGEVGLILCDYFLYHPLQ